MSQPLTARSQTAPTGPSGLRDVHAAVGPATCRPYRAWTKGKVERPIRYLRESFFYGRE